jgi:2-polyprenyl-3-methyl-5-hydroxy-6-metoxy-1,4-benzoquinol methylase
MAAAARSTNEAKFETRNPVVRRLIDRFYRRIAATIAPLEPSSVLDAGCGEGESIARLSLPADVVGVDTSPAAVAAASRRFPGHEIRRESVDDLPFADGRFDLVLCLEVLEHLRAPEAALAELARVARRDVVVSVPHEPWFRLGTALRGRYLRRLGDHPEHLGHWGRGGLRRLLEPRFEVVSLGGSFPWLIAHCRPR